MADFKGKNIVTEVDIIDDGIPLSDNTKMYIDTEYTFRQIYLSRLFDWIKGKMTLTIYPVGSVYMTFSEDNPADTFGGTWEKIQSRFLLGSGDNYSVGNTGGEENVILNTQQIPAHNHSASTSSSGSHAHSVSNGGSHSHTATSGGGGSHSHSVSLSGGDHRHTATTSWTGDHHHSPWDGKMFTTNTTTDTADVARRKFQSGSSYYAMSASNIDNISQAGGTTTAGGHNHTLTTDAGGGHSHSGNTGSVANHTHSITISNSGNHTHSMLNSGDHTHKITVNNAGGNQAHTNMPPYTVVNIWRRVS